MRILQPIKPISKLFLEFFESEKSGGMVLIAASVISLFLANSAVNIEYNHFWNKDLGGHSLLQWINDGLMAIFFLLIGLELEREIYQGEFSTVKSASLPIFGALGGMLVPAAIFLLFNFGTETQAGAGIPMATDIAFAIGILSLLGDKVPVSLKVFLTGIAIIDDLGAIIMIAVFYTQDLNLLNLFFAFGTLACLIVMNRMKIHHLLPYLIGGGFMWYFMLNSGVHATIAGVLLALAIPFGDGGENSPSYKLQHILHTPVAFIILPIFALANTAFVIPSDWYSNLLNSYSIGITLGLVIGKPVGITLFCAIAIGLGISKMPDGMNWRKMFGIGLLAGIGFTMSMFISLLAFSDASVVNQSKIAILLASVIAAVAGYFFLKFSLRKSRSNVATN
jgi:NhaA family Na+:H+ antiporter